MLVVLLAAEGPPPLVYISLLTSVIGPLISFFVIKQKNSGKVATTEAADLWHESTELRKELQRRIDLLESRLEQVTAREQELRARLNELEIENQILREKNMRLLVRAERSGTAADEPARHHKGETQQ